MSSSHALCYLALAKKQKNDFNFFCSMSTASADNPYLDYSGYPKNLIQ